MTIFSSFFSGNIYMWHLFLSVGEVQIQLAIIFLQNLMLLHCGFFFFSVKMLVVIVIFLLLFVLGGCLFLQFFSFLFSFQHFYYNTPRWYVFVDIILGVCRYLESLAWYLFSHLGNSHPHLFSNIVLPHSLFPFLLWLNTIIFVICHFCFLI